MASAPPKPAAAWLRPRKPAVVIAPLPAPAWLRPHKPAVASDPQACPCSAAHVQELVVATQAQMWWLMMMDEPLRAAHPRFTRLMEDVFNHPTTLKVFKVRGQGPFKGRRRVEAHILAPWL